MDDRQERKNFIRGLNLNFSFVTAIIERERDGEAEVLVQTSWKPEKDPLYLGALEILAGPMDRFEDVYTALAREVLEETGLRVTSFYPDARTQVHAARGGEVFAIVPYCCVHQIKGLVG